eukprot:9543000-Alexandrium_andersonii.AAC.1
MYIEDNPCPVFWSVQSTGFKQQLRDAHALTACSALQALRFMQPKAAGSCSMQLSAAFGRFVQLCAPLGALSRWLRAPKDAR